ncbi:MAG: M67 family metallopeptidase [Nitrospirae bacterium]|nr:M67 family metallopeptidase [Nitrospirota bacterium]
MHDAITIPQQIFDDMIAHCRNGYPNEACGILAGTAHEVSRLYLMQNAEASPVSYLMDSKEQFTVMKSMREAKLSMVALFHSHPDSAAYPSAKDVQLAFYEDSAYVIVSLSASEPVAKAFLIKNGAVEEIAINCTNT